MQSRELNRAPDWLRMKSRSDRPIKIRFGGILLFGRATNRTTKILIAVACYMNEFRLFRFDHSFATAAFKVAVALCINGPLTLIS